jgi:GDP-4-dehydro-6-deoxy-D-mannose reductase
VTERVLITGITGMVGSHLTDYLLAETDWQIHGLARWRSPLDNLHHLLPELNSGSRLELVEGDLTDGQSLERVVDNVQPTIVFHLAAQSYPTASFQSPVATLDANVLGTARLLQALQMRAPVGTRIHVCSSSEVFGRVPPEFLPINEAAPFHPASPYSISKIGTDLIGQFWAEAYGMNIWITRMFTHTGPRRGDTFAESSFAKQIALIEHRKIDPVIRVGNLDSLRTWADVRDAVRAYFLLVTKSPPAGSTFNIGGDYTCTIGEMLNYLISLSPVKDEIQIEVDPARLRPLDANLQVPDSSKFRDATGWRPEFRFETTMEDLLNYWRERVASQGAFGGR